MDIPFFTVGLRPACLVAVNAEPCPPDIPDVEYERTEMTAYVGPDKSNEEVKLFFADDTVQMAWWHGDNDPVSGERAYYIVRYALILRESTRLNVIRLQHRPAGNFLPCTADPVTGTFMCLYQTYEDGQRAVLVVDHDGDGVFDEVEVGRSGDVGVIMGRQSLNLRSNAWSFVGATSDGTLFVTMGRLQ